MNGAFEILVFLVFFAPIGLTVAMNLAMYRDARYDAQPPAPMRPETRAEPAPAADEYEFRKAA